jgi:hypothetical protein
MEKDKKRRTRHNEKKMTKKFLKGKNQRCGRIQINKERMECAVV